MLEELLRRNEMFSKGELSIDGKKLEEARLANIGGQRPHTVVVACSDSRVVPEYIFGANIGELFVIRIAGNRTDEAGLGSIEYAIEHLGVKNIVVLGHESCGAVGGALSFEGEPNNPLEKLLSKIKKSIEGSEGIEEAVKRNAKASAEEIRAALSHIPEVENGEVVFIPAVYSFKDGKVRLIE